MKSDKKVLSMLEDFWLPRREGGRGTEISTLPGGQNLGEISDLEYFRNRLYDALNVPRSRQPGASDGFSLGRSSEILRDEVKFSKFVARLRKRFAGLFNDILKTQLILKNVITPDDWEMLKDNIQYDFLYDNHFAELKETELMQERFNLLAQAEPYIGKYYSQQFIRTKILRQTDGEMVEEDKQIEKEIESGAIPDPALIDPATGEMMVPGGGPESPEEGAPPPQPQQSTGPDPEMGRPAQDNEINVNIDKPVKMPEKGLGEI